jgi:teichoic acid transport system permease protein
VLAAVVLINSTAMGNRGRLIAPGGLQDELAGEADDGPATGEPLAGLAARYGLRPSSARPGLASYLVRVWQRRQFIVTYATARNVSMYTEARLGQLWQVLTPLLNSAVYYLIFGVLFKANRGITNYTAYLVTGVFIFAFTERSIVVGSTVMRANISLIRALHFPRACLPLAYVLVEFQQLLLSMFVLFAIVLGTGEPLTWYWLLLIPTLVLQATFNVGAALLLARFGAGAQDISQLVPFLLRVWRYFCGVMYSIASLPASLPEWAKNVLSFNPAAVYISLGARGARVSYHDPYVPAWQVDGHDVPRASGLQAAVAAADLVIVLQAHRDYDLARIGAGARLLLDTRGVVPPALHVEAL